MDGLEADAAGTVDGVEEEVSVGEVLDYGVGPVAEVSVAEYDTMARGSAFPVKSGDFPSGAFVVAVDEYHVGGSTHARYHAR